MHLAVAGCLFNDILRARARGIEVDELRVSADGGFEGDRLASTGITYEVDLAADCPDEVLRALVAECEAKAAIPYTLREGTSVEASSVTIKGAR
jgi:OsmC-like protein